MAIFWSSKGDRVKRLLVRRCSHSAQQHQREQLYAGLAVGHPKYPLECTLPSYRFHHVEARTCTRAKPELEAAALTHLRRFVKPSLGGKAFKTEPPVVFFPLDPKKRHQKLRQPADLRLCRLPGRSRAGIVFTRESRGSRRYRAYVITDSRLGVHPNFPPLCTSHRV